MEWATVQPGRLHRRASVGQAGSCVCIVLATGKVQTLCESRPDASSELIATIGELGFAEVALRGRNKSRSGSSVQGCPAVYANVWNDASLGCGGAVELRVGRAGIA